MKAYHSAYPRKDNSMPYHNLRQSFRLLQFFTIVCSVLLILISSSHSYATGRSFFGLAGTGYINKPVISIREQKFSKIIQQKTDFSCGAAALATLLNYLYHQKVSEKDILVSMFKLGNEELIRQKGFSLLDIKNYVKSIGMRGRGYQVTLNKLYDIRIPTIALLDIDGYRHFVVIRRIEEDRVFIADPALGNRIMELEDFDNAWNGIVFAVLGKGLDKNSALLYPPEPLTARKLLTVSAPLTNSELLDFGFSHAELF
jgi:uncharacterized protein